jgi:hypothetical protein
MCVERQSAAGCGDLLLRHLEGKLMREPRARDRERKRERERGGRRLGDKRKKSARRKRNRRPSARPAQRIRCVRSTQLLNYCRLERRAREQHSQDVNASAVARNWTNYRHRAPRRLIGSSRATTRSLDSVERFRVAILARVQKLRNSSSHYAPCVHALIKMHFTRRRRYPV